MQMLVDYFGFSSNDNVSYQDFWTILSLNFIVFQEVKPKFGYKYAMWYPGITFYWTNNEKWHFEISGSGCRVLERLNSNFSWEGLFEFLRPFLVNKYIHIARLDIACDDMEGNLSFNKMFQHLRQNKYISRVQNIHWTEGSEQSIYVGAPKSAKRLRIYNKALEQNVEGDWVRVEFQLRNDEALQFVLNLYEYDYNFNYLFLGFLNKTIRFTETVVDKENKHHSRAKVASWWFKFVKGIKLNKYLRLLGKEYDVDSLIRYIQQSCGSSIKTYMHITGGDIGSLLDLLKDVQVNQKQQRLIDDIEKKEW